MDAIIIESPFTPEDVKNVIWECGSEKAPGPDEFTFKFFKTFWSTIRDLALGCNSSFIILERKIKDSPTLNEFHQTSLI